MRPQSRHAELVSASIGERRHASRKWTLKRVQGDAVLLALTALTASPATAQPAAPVDYSKPASWLCLPGRSDTCSTPQPTAELRPDGFGPVTRSAVATEPAVDCFLVYPTVSRDRGMNSDLIPGRGEEKSSIESQFARFAGACRIFAPLYRQMTTSAVAAAAAGADVTGPAVLAYGDVRDAWRTYLKTHNKGRPFVLIGHSQGSLMLIRLIQNEIEGKPIARQMKLAIVPGFNVLVPIGKRVGGSFKSTPLCATATDTGCILSWASYRERNIPPPGALFGFADQPGMTVACTNPAKPGSTAWQKIASVWDTGWNYAVPGGPIVWSSSGRAPAEYLTTPGLVSARCVNDGPRGYLSVRTHADPADARTDRIGGEIGLLGFFLPGWGMHLADINVALGSLVDRVAALTPDRPKPARDPLAAQ